MTFYAVDSKRQSMRSTGIVNEVRDWVDGPDGKRRPAETQARDEDTGMPVWEVEVTYRQQAFGRVSSTTGFVRVGSAVQPVLGEFEPVTFRGLTVEVRVNKAGGMVESWRAEEMDDRATGSSRPSTSAAASQSSSSASGKAA